MVPDTLLGPLFNYLDLHQRSEGGRDAEEEMAAASMGSTEGELEDFKVMLSLSQK